MDQVGLRALSLMEKSEAGPERRKVAPPLAFLVLALVSATSLSAAHAETLADALALAYQSNPILQQARAQQRALDETSVQARTGWRPSVGVTASDDFEQVFQRPNFNVNSGGATLNLSQPLYTSGRTSASVRSADAGVRAGREALRATEATVLLSVVQAYEDVLRDQAVLKVRQDDVSSLSAVMDEVTAKFEAGQNTRTDTFQIRTRLATAQSSESAAVAQLQNSRAEYAGAVGHNPRTLVAPAPLPHLPLSVDAAFDDAEEQNPNLREAKFDEQASRERIAEAKAGLGPFVAVGAQVGYSGTTTPAQTVDYDRALTAQVTVTQPLFTGGLATSLIRQAVEQNAADRVGVERTRRDVVRLVAQAWNQVVLSQTVQSSDQRAYEAAKLEIDGMRIEYKAALRSTLEVLSAYDVLRETELELAVASHDQYIAEANLLSAVGKLEAAYLLPGAELYYPEVNFKRVKDRGATPYEGLIAGLDSLSVGHVGDLSPIPPLAASKAPPTTPPGIEPSPSAALATTSPVLLTPNFTRVAPSGLLQLAPPSAKPVRVQIGAFPNMNLAELGWRDLLKRFPAETAGKSKEITAVEADGTMHYRTVVLGFSGRGAAKRFCDLIAAKGKACFVRSGG